MMAPGTNPEEDPLYSRKVLEMVTVAHEYCAFVDKAEQHPLTELIAYFQKILPLIYLKSALLPRVEVTDEGAVEHYVTEEQWEEIFNKVHNIFGPSDEFWYIDPLEKSHRDPIRGSLAECLTDIYQDLRDFLMLYQNPLRTFKENAVKDCQYLFETRFGLKLIHAQVALHALLYPAMENDYFLS